jgi:hypothetical protein
MSGRIRDGMHCPLVHFATRLKQRLVLVQKKDQLNTFPLRLPIHFPFTPPTLPLLSWRSSRSVVGVQRECKGNVKEIQHVFRAKYGVLSNILISFYDFIVFRLNWQMDCLNEIISSSQCFCFLTANDNEL